MSRLRGCFSKLKAGGEVALIGYVTAGDPSPDKTADVVGALVKGGVDVVELGIPFSDPIADGSTIQAASLRALSAGTTPSMVLEMAGKCKRLYGTPMVLLTYYNIVYKMGLKNYFERCGREDVDGVVIPDLPLEESHDCREEASKQGVDLIYLAAPSTTDKRLRDIVEHASGFLYLVSTYGVTGTRAELENSTLDLLNRVLPVAKDKIPLAVGFGISKPEHVLALARAGVNGVIVGSAFVQTVEKYGTRPDVLFKRLVDQAMSLKKETLRKPR